jgi:hypothetical protein
LPILEKFAPLLRRQIADEGVEGALKTAFNLERPEAAQNQVHGKGLLLRGETTEVPL